MELEIINIEEQLLIGIHKEMSLMNNLTPQLWQAFKPRLQEIKSRTDHLLISLQIYPGNYFTEFNPERHFRKWAAVQTNSDSDVPKDLELLHLVGGDYAVFHYKGPLHDKSIFQKIFTEWIPQSAFALDNRPHFERFSDGLTLQSPEWEETIYVPVIKKE
ncbi:MAG: GyrI-like domain-containing protein [Saprospiraceae bacterium]|nr:GyrI-like domain-containing protein [Saprospiraceae bacterium]MBK7796850.1 GyrI-like domain-containing protein [Saprospiraceae bacterium]MBL0259771.1 GyrI-like domain-containing protein [Saprospiraceae bacterium]